LPSWPALTGMTGKDLAVQIGHYKANVANVQNLEKQAGTIEQNEQTAILNGQQFLDRSKELPGKQISRSPTR
jgi:hypothetical protein